MKYATSLFVFAAACATLFARPALAGRCESGLGDLPRCTCPDFHQLLQEPGSHVACRPGWTPVIYDLGGQFPLDSASSSFTLTASNSTECPGLVKTGVPFRGKILGCWGPLEKDGCRAFQTPFQGQCLSIDPFTLGGTCNDKCKNLTTGLLGIGNAGNGAYRVCPPENPSVSCRATNFAGDEQFRFQTGGLCVTGGCQEGEVVPGSDGCQSGWGASYFGFRFHVPPGHYDWPSGAFKVMLNQKRPTCGALYDCLGPRAQWVITMVGVPEPGAQLPCFGTDGGTCNPEGCFK
jgi:hypothetical protein